MTIRRLHAVALGGALLVCHAGCVSSAPFANAWHDLKMRLRPETNGPRSMTENVDNNWAFVGKERQNRAGMPTTDLNDDFYRKYFMSDKARQIEANLGIK